MIPVAHAQGVEQNLELQLKLVGIVEALAKLRCSKDSLLFRDHVTSAMELGKKLSLLVAPVEVKGLYVIKKPFL